MKQNKIMVIVYDIPTKHYLQFHNMITYTNKNVGLRTSWEFKSENPDSNIDTMLV